MIGNFKTLLLIFEKWKKVNHSKKEAIKEIRCDLEKAKKEKKERKMGTLNILI